MDFASVDALTPLIKKGANPVSLRREVRLWNTGRAWPTFELNTVASAVYGQPFAWLYRPDLLEVLNRAVTESAQTQFILVARLSKKPGE
jgi:salicylate hydroxylase